MRLLKYYKMKLHYLLNGNGWLGNFALVRVCTSLLKPGIQMELLHLTNFWTSFLKPGKTLVTNLYMFDISYAPWNHWGSNERQVHRSQFSSHYSRLCNFSFILILELLQQRGKDAVITTLRNEDGNTVNSSLHLPKWWPEKKTLTKSFVERSHGEKLLVDQIHDMLNQGDKEGVIGRQVCITGLGGIGKSTLVKWYAHRFAVVYDHIIWLDCGENSLERSINSLFQAVFQDCGQKEWLLSTQDKANRIFRAVGSHQCMFIYDNAEDWKGKRGIMHTLPKADCPTIKCLITSRWTSWGSKAGYGILPQLNLETFSPTESLKLLTENLVDVDFTPADLNVLAELLGHLPLALQIALANLNEYYTDRNNGVAAYIKAIRVELRNKGSLYDGLLQSAVEIDDYNKGLMATLMETTSKWKGQEGIGSVAWEILSILAYLPPDNVQLGFVSSVAKVNEHTSLAACHLLKKYSLASITLNQPESFLPFRLSVNGKESESESDSESSSEPEYYVAVHRLLQRCMQLMNSSDVGVYTSRILGSPISSDLDILYKWDLFLEHKRRPKSELLKDFQVARYQIYNDMTAGQFIFRQRFSDALVLFDVWKEMTAGAGDKSAQAAMQIALTFFHGVVSCLVENKVAALADFRFVKSCTAEISNVCQRNFNDCDPAVLNLIVSFPFAQLQSSADLIILDIATICRLWMIKVLYELKMTEEGRKECKELFDKSQGVLRVWQCHFGTFSFENLGAEHFESIELKEDMSFGGFQRWIQKFPEKVFERCSSYCVNFVDVDMGVITNVAYHSVLPSRCYTINISAQSPEPDSRDMKGTTAVEVHIAELWGELQVLKIEHCAIKWDIPKQSSKLKILMVAFPRNPLPRHISLSTMMPHLNSLQLFGALQLYVPYSFLPSRLEQLYLQNVVLTDTDQRIGEQPTMGALIIMVKSIEEAEPFLHLLTFDDLAIFPQASIDDEKIVEFSSNYDPLIRILDVSPQTTIRAAFTPEALTELQLRGVSLSSSRPSDGQDTVRRNWNFEGRALVSYDDTVMVTYGKFF